MLAEDQVAKFERPPERLTIQCGGSEKVLFMSFARLNNCLRAIEDPDRLPVMMIDPDVSDLIIRLMLAPTPTTDPREVQIGEEDMSMDTIDDILLWVRDHLSAFFLKRFQQVGAQLAKMEPEAARLVSSLTGSAGSTSNEPPAGPST